MVRVGSNSNINIVVRVQLDHAIMNALGFGDERRFIRLCRTRLNQQTDDGRSNTGNAELTLNVCHRTFLYPCSCFQGETVWSEN